MNARRASLALIVAAVTVVAGAARANLPFKEDFSNGLDTKVWKVSGGNWVLENGELVARNSDRATGDKDPLTGFPYGTFDYVATLGVGTNMTLQVDATPLKLSVEVDADGKLVKGSFARIGLMVHSNGAAQFADKKWMLLWGWLDTRNSFGLSLLEEAIAWRAGDNTTNLEIGKTYTFKLEVKGKHVKGKVWPKGTQEPDWMLEDDFQGQLTASGIGLLGVGVDVRYDNLSAEPIAGAKATISGTVTDSQTGKAVSNATVTNGEVSAKTKSDGTYSLEVVAGAQEIVASKDGYIPTATEDAVEVAEGGFIGDANIGLRSVKIPLSDDFNGGAKLEWQVPTSADFNGQWTAEKDAYTAMNSQLLDEPPATGGLPAHGVWDYSYYPDVATDLTLSAKVTPLAFGSGPFARIGLLMHANGQGGSADKKWMLLYGKLDNLEGSPLGLSLLEEGVAWKAALQTLKLETGKTYVFKMAAKGADVKGKVWQDGTAEPADWQVRDTFSLNQIREAGIGLLGVGADVTYDDVQVTNYVEDVGPPPTTVVQGDLNGDGKVAIQDVVLGLQILAGLKTITADGLAAGDFNKNGKLDISEVIGILRAVAGLVIQG